MSDEKPCPFCGDESEYLRFLDLCAERANEKWRENEVKTMIDLYTSMDFVQVVRCRDCKNYDESDAGCNYFVLAENKLLHIKNPDAFCAWAERKEL